MIKTLEELVDDMNERVYRIRIDVLMKNLNKYKAQKELLNQMFWESYGIELNDENNYLELRKYIGRIKSEIKELRDTIEKLKSRLTIEGLKTSFEITGTELFKMAQKYLTIVKKYEAYMNLYKQLDMRPSLENEITMVKKLKTNIYLSEKSTRRIIRTETTTFNALSALEIKEVLGFWEYKELEDEELLDFINKNQSMFQRGYSSNYLVRGSIIFYTIYPTELSI